MNREKLKEHRKKLAVIIIIIGFLSAVPIIIIQLNQSSYRLVDIDYPSNSKNVTNGKLYTTAEGLPVLDLSGSYYEMGYAHGLLVGKYIKYVLEFGFEAAMKSSRANYNELRNVFENNPELVDMSNEMHAQEIKGIFDGAKDSGADRYVSSLWKEWDEIDLWILNTIYEWNQEFGCSGLGVWGLASFGGKTFIGRDLDFPSDKKGYVAQLYSLIIYRGNESNNEVYSFNLPGCVICLTGFNDKGAWISTDNSNGPKNMNPGRKPGGISMRNFLEQEDGKNVINDAVDFFKNQSPFISFLYLVGGPESTDDPVAVLEGNTTNVIARKGSEEQHDYVYLTNHQRKMREPVNCSRYDKYTSNFLKYTSEGDSVVDDSELLQMVSDSGSSWTQLTVIFCPNTLDFNVGIVQIIEGSTRGAFENPLIDHNYNPRDF